VLDLTAPTPEQLDRAVRFIDAESSVGRVYVHCKIGYSRSAAAVAAYLLFCKRAETVADAMTIIGRARPQIAVSSAALKTLEEFRLRLLVSPKPDTFLLASPVVCGS
jgi:protein-tyrosine phosphatase